MNPQEWISVLQDAALNPLGMPAPGMPQIQGLPEMPWMRPPVMRTPGRP
jgi:hypothetical protein